jgi:NAD(P)-dependent dehydrogenase (short-subunit alcohol dehydrogenase family)
MARIRSLKHWLDNRNFVPYNIIGSVLRFLSIPTIHEISHEMSSLGPLINQDYAVMFAYTARWRWSTHRCIKCTACTDPLSNGPDFDINIEGKEMPHSSLEKHALIIGASRGLGYALAQEYLNRGWHVVATVRGLNQTKLHTLLNSADGRLEIETVDITLPDQIASLYERLVSRRFDLLFVNAGVTNQPEGTVGEVSTEEFVRVMITNALSPIRVIETLQDLVPSTGAIAVMSSGQGSVANNETGGHEVYRGSKAALNTFMRSFAARHTDDPRTLVLMAPGWVQTEMGGPEARLSIEESIPNVVTTLDAQTGKPGLQYLDYLGRTVPW